MTESIMPQVKNIVFLMLENRSLDNLLGWLYTPSSSWDCPPSPLYVYPKGSSNKYNGLTQGMYSNPDPDSGDLIPVVQLSDSNWQSGYAVPYLDPYEALRAYPSDPRASNNWKGVMNQFFGNQTIITGLPSESDGEPKMKGFLQDYKYWRDGSWEGKDILWTYTPTQANIINSIALQYGVSDRWFCWYRQRQPQTVRIRFAVRPLAMRVTQLLLTITLLSLMLLELRRAGGSMGST